KPQIRNGEYCTRNSSHRAAWPDELHALNHEGEHQHADEGKKRPAENGERFKGLIRERGSPPSAHDLLGQMGHPVADDDRGRPSQHTVERGSTPSGTKKAHKLDGRSDKS